MSAPQKRITESEAWRKFAAALDTHAAGGLTDAALREIAFSLQEAQALLPPPLKCPVCGSGYAHRTETLLTTGSFYLLGEGVKFINSDAEPQREDETYACCICKVTLIPKDGRLSTPPTPAIAPRMLTVGALSINTESHMVTLSGQRIELCRREYELLVHLASEPDRVFTKTELLRSVWGFQSPGATRTVDSHACRLRRKLSARGGRWVVNVWGVGYRLH